MCVVCATAIEGAVLCVRCFEHKHVHGEFQFQRASFNVPMTSLCWGILAAICLGFAQLGIVFGPIAIMYGISALRRIRRQPGLPGEKLAVSGIVLGAFGCLEFFAFWIWILLKS